jgi:putative ABC transport system permease protein
MQLDAADDIAAIDGVEAVVPTVTLLWDNEGGGASFGVPDQISGSVAGADEGNESFDIKIAQGRDLTVDDEGSNVVLLGSDIASKNGATVGQTIEIRDVDFEVVGILESTLTAPDNTAFTPLAAAQQLFHADLPPVLAGQLDASELITMVVVYPADGNAIGTLASSIESSIPNVKTMTGDEFDAQVGSATAIFNAIIIGVALISLVVGGLSVINTMAMSVAERTREIGIKRAIGGSRRRIIRELVVEAGLIGMIGGLIGLALGAIVVVLANDAGRASGTVLFELTSGTAITAVVFSTILGAIAGIIPATHAARLDPVSALRYE